MNAENFVEAVERFFLDIIGVIIPGATLMAGMWVLFGSLSLGTVTLTAPSTDSAWVMATVLAYVLGHALTSLGDRLVVPTAAKLTGVWGLNWLTEKFDTETKLFTEHKADTSVVAVGEAAYGKGWRPPSLDEFKGLRNTAITFASAQERILHRFTFISLLNQGVATALWALALMALIQQIVQAYQSSSLTDGATHVGIGLLLMLGLFAISLVFLERRFDFYRRTQLTPFSIAVAALKEKKDREEKAGGGTAPASAPAVFLAGGTAGWQAQVVTDAPGARYLDGSAHGLADPKAATEWELAAVRASELVFANLQAVDPGYSLALVIGYAKALGKHVVLVDQKSTAPPAAAAALAALPAQANATFPTLAEGITYLQQRLKLT